MNRSLRVALVAFGAATAFFAWPSIARADDCVVTPGLYSATWERDTVNVSNIGTPAQGHVFPQQTNARAVLGGNFLFLADCDGTITLKTPDTQASYTFGSYARADGPGILDARTVTALVPFHFAVIGKATKGLGNFPTLHLSATNGARCPTGGMGTEGLIFCLNAMTETWTFTGVRDETDPALKIHSTIFKEISGNAPFNAASRANHSQLNANTTYILSHKDPYAPEADTLPGTHLGATDGYTMVLVTEPPTLTVTKDIESVFLDTVPSVTVEIRANVDSWGAKGANGKDVKFDFEGKQQTVPASAMQASMAIVNFEVGNLKAGDHLVTVTATNLAGVAGKKTFPIHVIPTPPWFRKFDNLKADGQIGLCSSGNTTECVEYSGSKKFVATNKMVGVIIPDIVPVVGGTWGLTPTSFTIKPLPLSRDGHAPGATPTGTGSFGLGGHLFPIVPRTDSQLYTRTTHDALNLEEADIRFDAVEVPFTKHVGLTSLIANLGDLTGIKGLGDWIRAADVACVDATISTGMEGARLDLAAKPTDAEVKITKFVTQLDLGVGVDAAINVGLAKGGAHAQVTGALNLSFAPTAKVEACHITFLAYVYYVTVFSNKFTTFPDPAAQTTVDACKPATSIASAPIERITNSLAAVNRPLFAQAQAATPPAPPAMPARDGTIHDALVAQVTTQGMPAGREATTLVDGVAVFNAAPAVAAGPQGRRALVWIGENLHAARPQAFQAQLRLFDGHAWAPNAPFIGDGKHPDAAPSVAFDGNGDVVAAWSINMTSNLSGSTADDAQAAHVLVEVVVCDGRTGAVKSRRTVSAGAGPDAGARVVAAPDGSVWAAWANYPASDYMSADAPVRIVAARWDRKTWSAPEAVANNVRGLRDWQFAARDASTAALIVDTTTAGARSVHVSERTNGAWKETFAKNAAPALDPRVAAGYDTGGKANALWGDAGSIMREAGGTVTTFTKADAGFPAAFVADAVATTALVRTPAGFVSIRMDGKSGKTASPVALGPLAPQFAAPGIARSGEDWLIAQSPILTASGHGPTFGGAPVILTSAKK